MEYEVHYRDGIFEVATHGGGDVKVFQELLSETLDHPQWRPGEPILIDHSNLNAGPLTVDGMAQLADMIQLARNELGSSRMAILAPGDLEYGLGRMWQVFVENKWDGEARIFRSREDAVRWLNGD